MNALFMNYKNLFIFGIFWSVSFNASTQYLTADFVKATNFDPVYSAALVDNKKDLLQAKIASMAYYPEARLSSSQLDNENSGRSTFSISQPVLNYDRWLLLKEADPKSALAAVKLSQSHQELAQRFFKVIVNLVDAREKLTLNKISLDAFTAQVASAVQSFNLGLGTITDVRDAQVRLAQTRSQSFSLRAVVDSSEREYFAIVGQMPPAQSYSLSTVLTPPTVDGFSEMTLRAEKSNPAILASQLGVNLAEIATRRSRASLYPSVTAFMQQSQLSGRPSSSNSGIALRMEIPLQAGRIFQGATADFELSKTQELARNTLQKTRLDLERSFSQLEAFQSELVVRAEAIKAAELSLQANEQSFVGGVRTKIDVLNALQALYQTRSDYAAAKLRLGESYLNLLILSAEEVESALTKVQSLIFLP